MLHYFSQIWSGQNIFEWFSEALSTAILKVRRPNEHFTTYP